ncbi:MAG: permease prefix domain 1-containing protein [bacterium]|nr:permease prefix domain 1-containing protein [bacterium]
METIQAYVESVFHHLPKTENVLQTKENITKHMMHKYKELKNQGYSENEAVAKVIAEFGNIDKQLQELGVSLVEETSTPSISLEQVKSYITVKKKTSILISIGVILCILGATFVCLFNGLAEDKVLTVLTDSDGDSMLSYLSLFVLVACAVALFIYSGSLTKEYQFIEHGIRLDSPTKQYLMTEQKQHQNRHTVLTIIGVVLCILSPISIFITEPIFTDHSSLPVVPFLLIISIAVFLFVFSGCQNAPYETLLKNANKTRQQRRVERIYGMVNSVILMIATVIFLIVGFYYDHWESAGIIYAVAGILCGISSTIIWGVSKVND